MRNFKSLLWLSLMLFLVAGCQKDDYPDPALDQVDQQTSSLKAAKKPAANLIGEMDLDFMFVNPVWVGTITFEGYEEVYGMRFIHLSPDKGFSQASPFEEYFEIYDLGNQDLVYLAGPDVGVTTVANKPPDPCPYRMNGEIDVATGPFEMWLGRHVHMSGMITWDNIGTPEEPIIVPKNAPGKFRIN